MYRYMETAQSNWCNTCINNLGKQLQLEKSFNELTFARFPQFSQKKFRKSNKNVFKCGPWPIQKQKKSKEVTLISYSEIISQKL